MLGRENGTMKETRGAAYKEIGDLEAGGSWW